MWLTPEDTLTVERDAGVRETLHRVGEGGKLPMDLPGRYSNPDCASDWTIALTDAGMTLRVDGPLRIGSAFEIEPVEDDFIRVITPMTLFRGWLDVRVVRDAERRIIGLDVDGSRARNLRFTREH
jgi:hypothetical protein